MFHKNVCVCACVCACMRACVFVYDVLMPSFRRKITRKRLHQHQSLRNVAQIFENVLSRSLLIFAMIRRKLLFVGNMVVFA